MIAPAATAASVGVVTRAPSTADAQRGAAGLLVPGRGPTVSRREALDALGTLPSCRPCDVRIFVALPPAGEHHNVTRYPIAILGPGYHGLLTSSRTRIPGLISVFDIAPTVRALERGEKPPITSRPDRNRGRTLARLDTRLSRTEDARNPASLVLISLLVVYGLIGIALRSRFFARTALLVPTVALACSLLLSGVGAERPSVVITVLGVVTGIGSLIAAALLRTPRLLGAAFLALILAYLIVMTAWPVTNSFSALGPNPASGSRFYGLRNDVATLLLVPAFLSAALLGRVLLLPIAMVSLVMVGASVSGADGGGAVVLLAGFLVLGLRLSGIALTWRRLALVGAVTVALALAFVGLDAALGGSSHVTRAISGGPGTVLGDIGARLHASWDVAIRSWYAILIVVVALAALGWLAAKKPRSPVLDALLAALAVSLVVNDTPTDVAGFGALSALAVWSWQRAERSLN